MVYLWVSASGKRCRERAFRPIRARRQDLPPVQWRRLALGEVEPFSRLRRREPTPLPAHRPDLPAWLEQALEHAIAVAPGDRFGDALEFAQELEHGLASGAPLRAPSRSIHERDPLRFWRAVAALLAAALLLTWMFGR